MSEYLPAPDPARFPELANARGAEWVRVIPAGTSLARIYRAAGQHPAAWHDFRAYGPVDARFDPHPMPVGEHPDDAVMYGVLESPRGAGTGAHDVYESSFAAALLEVFQTESTIRIEVGAPTFVTFSTSRPVRLLDLSDSDWVTVAGGNAAISSGHRYASRKWARAIRTRYPDLDGVTSASSVIPSARIVALWGPAVTALPERPRVSLPLQTPELTGLVYRIADRYGYRIVR